MANTTPIKNVAIVGASGNLGSLILSSLLAAGTFNITALTRADSSATLPSHSSLSIKKGDYDSPAFLQSAFKGNDVLVLALHFSAVPELEIKLIEAAAEAGVRWIVPTEFGSDNANEGISNVPINAAKVAPREKIEELGLSWIGVVTNPWLDYSLKNGLFSIDAKWRTATLYDGGKFRFNTTVMATVGTAVAKLLGLPGSTLDSFRNQFVYISSFLVSQEDILASVQRVSGTKPEDWKITMVGAQEYIDDGGRKVGQGDFSGVINLLYGKMFKAGDGGDYQNTRGLSNDLLGLEKEDLDTVVRKVLDGSSAS